MDIGSMMTAVQNQAAKRIASGLTASRGNGLTTSAAATAGSAKLAAAAASGATGTATSATAAASTSGITSNDFLTLLVTEMKNQDPTQPTDPNAYIQQLVGVNSLQQLISINSELGAATPATPTPTPPVTGGVTG